MYCRNCGKEIDSNLVQCPYCSTYQNQMNINDNDSIWWCVLGCCIPIVGLILYIVWRDTKPKCGKKAGIGALIGFVLGILSTIMIYLFVFYAFALVGRMG